MLARHMQTTQAEPLEGQVLNSAGGYSYPVDKWVRLRRFLILGSEGGSYYIGERQLTRENATSLLECVREDPGRTIQMIVDGSREAPKIGPSLFALALVSTVVPEALDRLNEVCRTGSHLLQFVAEADQLRGWGRKLRESVGGWYEREDLAYQLVKYRQRAGWTHRDVLRVTHPTPGTNAGLLAWVAQGVAPDDRLVQGFLELQGATTEGEVCEILLRDDRLPWEAVPSEWLKSPRVWEILLYRLPIWALTRNLGRLTTLGLLDPFSEGQSHVIARLSNEAVKLHPYNVLVALKTYAQGRGVKGSLSWQPNGRVIEALDDAYYASFGHVTPTNRRVVLALDVSGSMSCPMMNGPLTCAEAAAAMAMVTARTEPNHEIVAFAEVMRPLSISAHERLDDVVRKTDIANFGGTDCALPMMWALGYNNKPRGYFHSGEYEKVRDRVVEADAFVVLTDSETWYGSLHPMEALRRYRQETGIPAKLVVTAFESNNFTIADPNDALCMDMVGWDASGPQVLSDFVAGRI